MTTTHEAPTLEQIVEIAPEVVLPRSVVKNTYKRRYAERVLTGEVRGKKGVSKKAQARSCSDWLALTLASLTLGEKDALNVERFEAILDANGIEHRHWNRTTKGWQGRLRMTGRLALQRVVAAEEQLFLPDGEPVKAPRSWVEKHQH